MLCARFPRVVRSSGAYCPFLNILARNRVNLSKDNPAKFRFEVHFDLQRAGLRVKAISLQNTEI